ncbi:MAG: outer membrane protein assembly factor BamD [Bordetella sp.]|nr:MAG: outer membrane protein assembly factor BamD [Bordetella sp.]
MILCSLTFFLYGCGNIFLKFDEFNNLNLEELYSKAKKEVLLGHWQNAKNYFNLIENNESSGPYTAQLLLDLAYVNWKDGEKYKALSILEQFFKFYPNHKKTDSALYMQGLLNIDSSKILVNFLTKQDPSERDIENLRLSYYSFVELINKFPLSKYLFDAKNHSVWLANTIAKHEMNIAEYYYNKGAYLAAINRAQIIIKNFGGLCEIKDALSLLTKSYKILDLFELENDFQYLFKKKF